MNSSHIGVVAGRKRHGGLQFFRMAHLGHAERRAFARRFHDQRQTQHFRHSAHLIRPLPIGCKPHIARCCQRIGQPHPLGHDLVHGDSRGQHAGAGVRNAQKFERSLRGSVFTEAAMQCDEATIDAIFL
jgi:hypothetical protein